MSRATGRMPWRPGEHTRYSACWRHEGSLSRMDFEQAVDVALECSSCTVEFRTPDGAA